MESRKEKGVKVLRYERNAEMLNNLKEISELCDEREEITLLSQASVRILIFSFLVNMNYAFQDRENIYLVMDLLNGGDLRYHISKH